MNSYKNVRFVDRLTKTPLISILTAPIRVCDDRTFIFTRIGMEFCKWVDPLDTMFPQSSLQIGDVLIRLREFRIPAFWERQTLVDGNATRFAFTCNGRTPQLGILDIGTNMVRSLGHIRAVSSNVFLVSTSNRLVSSAGVWPGILISHVCAFSVAGRRCLRIARPVPHGDTGIDRSYGGPRKYFNSLRRKVSWIHCVCYT